MVSTRQPDQALQRSACYVRAITECSVTVGRLKNYVFLQAARRTWPLTFSAIWILDEAAWVGRTTCAKLRRCRATQWPGRRVGTVGDQSIGNR